MGLKVGDKVTFHDLIYGMLLASGNDAANTAAIAIDGSIPSFAVRMNKRATEIGMKNTNFVTPSGLDDENHYTTSYELAKIARYAMKNPTFREIVSTVKEVIPSADGSRILVNHNKLLKSYDGAIGIKTGFTKKCGRCLVSCAEKDGVELIAVTLNAPNDWQDHKNMLEYGFSLYESVHLADAGDYNISLSCVNGRKSNLLCTNFTSLSTTLKKGSKSNLTAIYEGKRFVFSPVKQGDKVGQIVYYLDGEKIASLDVYALESIKTIKYKKSIFERIFG
jgi:D-alanyl-D-alanine carboxypeptidase